MKSNQIILLLSAILTLSSLAAERVYVSSGGPENDAAIYAVDFEAGELSPPQRLVTTGRKAEIELSNDGSILYAIIGREDDQESGEFIAFRIGEDGALSEISRLSEGVGNYCSLALSEDGTGLVAASYADGEVDSFLLNSDGTVRKAVTRVAFPKFSSGKRELARAHDVEFHRNGRLVFATDIANNRVYRLGFEPTTAKLELLDHKSCEAFFGPRHLIQDKASQFLYVLNQRGSRVVTFKQTLDGELKGIQSISTLPPDQREINNHSAEVLLHPNEKFLYASNRGHNSLAVFSREADGTLTEVQIVSSGGEAPWSFVLADDGNHLICSNRKSNSLVVFSINPNTGELTATGTEITIPDPLKMTIRH